MLNQKSFLRINSITIGSVLVLILVGSIVRSMGAGMGCPDWPKCFGSYIPPSDVEKLPENYLDIFKEQRITKNKRLAKTFSSFGYDELALKITNDPSVLVEQEFNVTKAWIEYINRLVGVLIGLLVFANMIFSFAYWRQKRGVTIVAILIFVLTGFQGWVGSLVVSTNLLHGFITFHMLLALLILALLIWINVRIRQLEKHKSQKIYWLSLASLLLFIPQVILGTEVRGIIDDLIISDSNRDSWQNFLTTSSFFIHRSYSWLILVGSIAIFLLIKKNNFSDLVKPSFGLIVLVFAAMLAGLVMVRFDFPFWLQPVHLIVATGIFSLLFYLTLRFRIKG